MDRTNIMRGMMTFANDAYLDAARGWARRLEDREARKGASSVADARTVVARKTGISPGTLENLRNGRAKGIAAHLFGRLRACVVSEITAEIQALEHELQLARACGLDPRDDEMAAVEAALATARALLGKA